MGFVVYWCYIGKGYYNRVYIGVKGIRVHGFLTLGVQGLGFSTT